MKTTFILILTFVLSFSAFSQQAQDTISGTNQTSVELVQKFEKDKAYLVDVRTPEEYNSGHLKYSQNIDFKSEEFKTQVNKLNKNKPVYLYCRSGNRSGKAAEVLKELGFKVYYNIGGFENLKAAGLPAE